MQEGKGEGDPWVWLDMELLGLLLLSEGAKGSKVIQEVRKQ